jgi:hypothetical protein
VGGERLHDGLVWILSATKRVGVLRVSALWLLGFSLSLSA